MDLNTQHTHTSIQELQKTVTYTVQNVVQTLTCR